MLYAADVRDWLKRLIAADHFYIGLIDNKHDKSVGVYPLSQSGYPVRGIGQDTTYDEFAVSVLIHWTKNANETERAARALFETLRTIKNASINGHRVYLIDLLTPAPVSVGTDDKGVFEQVIEFQITYERK